MNTEADLSSWLLWILLQYMNTEAPLWYISIRPSSAHTGPSGAHIRPSGVHPECHSWVMVSFSALLGGKVVCFWGISCQVYRDYMAFPPAVQVLSSICCYLFLDASHSDWSERKSQKELWFAFPWGLKIVNQSELTERDRAMWWKGRKTEHVSSNANWCGDTFTPWRWRKQESELDTQHNHHCRRGVHCSNHYKSHSINKVSVCRM